MIENIRTEGFKGFDINEPVPLKAVYTGKNKSGKSTRAGAIAIALYGHIPFSTAGKRPRDILDSFGKDSLVAAVTVNGVEFGRKFMRNGKGVVSQSLQVKGKRASAENFAILLNKAGAPRIANVAEFMKQSEAKKIDTLFDLFPNDELDDIDSEIEKAKEDVSKFEKKKTGAESTVVRLTNSKQSIEIPSGSVAEIQSEINKVEIQIVELSEQIKKAEIEEAKIKAKAEGERQEKERAEKEAEDKKADPVGAVISKGEKQIDDYKAANGFGEDQDIVGGHNVPDSGGSFVFPGSKKPDENMQSPESFGHALATDIAVEISGLAISSIKRIIEALNGSGCGTCAALIVAKQELKKFKEVS